MISFGIGVVCFLIGLIRAQWTGMRLQEFAWPYVGIFMMVQGIIEFAVRGR